MLSNELKRLGRRELVDIIYQMKKNEQQLQEENAALQEKLQDRRLRVSMAGSIAEAATDITEIFSAAQITANLYLHEISCMKADTAKECEQLLAQAREQHRAILEESEERLARLNAEYATQLERLRQLKEETEALEIKKNSEFCED